MDRLDLTVAVHVGITGPLGFARASANTFAKQHAHCATVPPRPHGQVAHTVAVEITQRCPACALPGAAPAEAVRAGFLVAAAPSVKS